jgi:putative membrane-bound dehydrogenase-like protein
MPVSLRSAGFVLLVFQALAAAGSAGRQEPPYAPDEALRTFQLPHGFRIEIVAAEPQIQDPVAMAFDARGRLFVVELPDYPLGEGNGRIKLLEDRDGDGRFETSTIFADGFHFPTGVLPWNDGVLVTAAPDIFYIADTNGDNRADTRRVVLTGFAATNPQLRVNGLLHGLDNWIYLSYPRVLQPQRYVQEFGDRGSPIHFPGFPDVPPVDALAKGTDLRFRVDPPRLEAVAGTGQFGNAFDAWGNRFTVWNNDHLRHVVVQEQYGSANPFLAVRSAMQSVSDHGNAAALYPITRQPLHIHESEVGHFTSASGISVDAGGTFAPPYEGAVFVCDPVHNLVHADRLSASGATFSASRALEGREFLASTDSWFRPVFTAGGPDGALYVVDFHRKLVEHPEWLPREMIQPADLQAGNNRGRIYRVVYDTSAAAPVPATPPADASSSQLVTYLAHPNAWWRATAQRLLVARQDRSVTPSLERLIGSGEAPPVARLHALWTLEGLGTLRAESVLQALEDVDPRIREHAVRLAESRLSNATVTNKLLRMTGDPSDRVQFQLACTLGRIHSPGSATFEALQRIAVGHLEDQWFQIAVLTGAADTAGAWVRLLTRRPDFTATHSSGKEDFIRRITSIVGSRRSAAEIEAVLSTVTPAGQPGSDWWQRAALDGVAAGLRHGVRDPIALSAPAQDLLLELLDTGSPGRRQAALDIARSLSLRISPALRQLVDAASRQALLTSASAEARAEAAGLLGLDPAGGTIATLGNLLSPQQPEPLQRAAAAALLSMRDVKSTTVLLQRWREYTGPVRELVASGFFSSRARVAALLDALEAGTLEADSLGRARSAQLRAHPDPEIRRRAQVLLPAAQVSNRTSVFEKYRGALKLDGNAARGHDTFVATCSACHRLGSTGIDVGPDLGGITGRDRENLLLQIVDPNASIVAGYEDYLVETADGRLISGIIALKTDTAVTLRRAGGGEDTVLRSSIVRLRSLALSPMPEGLETGMTLQDMADLLQYLKTYRGEQ